MKWKLFKDEKPRKNSAVLLLIVMDDYIWAGVHNCYMHEDKYPNDTGEGCTHKPYHPHGCEWEKGELKENACLWPEEYMKAWMYVDDLAYLAPEEILPKCMTKNK